jgi:hypothetical protein
LIKKVNDFEPSFENDGFFCGVKKLKVNNKFPIVIICMPLVISQATVMTGEEID